MLILIEKDSATRVPKECTPEQAAGFAAEFPVHVVGDDGTTVPYAEWKAAQEPLTRETVEIESTDQVPALTTDVITILTTDEIAALTPDQVPALEAVQVHADE